MCPNRELWANITACILPTCTIREALKAENISALLCNNPVRDRTLEIKLTGPILSGIAIIFVVIRVAARRPFTTNLFSWDDGLIVAAAVLAIPATIVHYYMAVNGMGRDVWTLPYDHITNVLRFLYVGEVLYILTIALTRISILTFYLRIFTNNKFQLVTKILIGLNVGNFVASIFPLLFQCSPVSLAWTHWDGEHSGHCIDFNAAAWANAAINMTLDLATLVVPLPSLFALQLSYSWSKRLRVFTMFSFGLVVTIISAIRLQTLIKFADSQNPTWDYAPTVIWTVIESKVGMICACLPMAKVFFTRLAPQWLGMTVPNTYGPRKTPKGSAPAKEWTNASSTIASTDRLAHKPYTESVFFTKMDEDQVRKGAFLRLHDVESNRTSQIGLAK